MSDDNVKLSLETIDRKSNKEYIIFNFVFQAEDSIRYLVRSRGLGDVYKRQAYEWGLVEKVAPDGTVLTEAMAFAGRIAAMPPLPVGMVKTTVNRLSGALDDLAAHMDTDQFALTNTCLLYTSDPADERSSVDLGGRRSIKKNTKPHQHNTTLTLRQLSIL